MEIFYEGKRVKWLHILRGYCSCENTPCEQCPWYNKKEERCTHEYYCVNLLMELEDGSEETITLPLYNDDSDP
ncbi:MAG: hypothetical protein ACTSR0_04185 [Candidatus Asgardarchaeia archaeon]